MSEIEFYTYLVLSILISVAILIVIIQNLVLNLRIKKRQGVKKLSLPSFKLSLNLILLVILIIVTFIVNENRNEGNIEPYPNNIINTYPNSDVDASCASFDNKLETSEIVLSFMDYVGIVILGNYEATSDFNFHNEDDFYYPYVIDVYSLSEISRSKGEIEIDNIYDIHHEAVDGSIYSDECDKVFGLRKDAIYLVFGNVSNQDHTIDNYYDALFPLKIIEIIGYDVSKAPADQSQDIVELLNNHGYFINH